MIIIPNMPPVCKVHLHHLVESLWQRPLEAGPTITIPQLIDEATEAQRGSGLSSLSLSGASKLQSNCLWPEAGGRGGSFC